MAMDSVCIVVLSYNGLQDTRKCLASLQGALRPGATPLLVDNGSTDGTQEAVAREFPWCQILRVDKNNGPSAGNNAGIRHALDAGFKWVLLLNNDTTVSEGLVERLMTAAAAHPDYKVIGPVINYMDEPALVMTDGVTFNPPGRGGLFIRKPVPLAEGRTPGITPVDVVNGCCMLISADVFRSIGLFDEEFFIYHDETDFCLRALEHGFKCGVISEQLVWHKGSSSFKATGKRFARYFDTRNLVYLLRKHRGARLHGRGRAQTASTCFRYLYFRYCHEREDGHPDAADAIIAGLLDGLAGRQGPFADRRRPMLPVVRALFEIARRRPRIQAPATSRS
jgi:GT2 family glycosyltransferase